MIAYAVRLYLRSALSLRDVEERLAERGVQVRYETVRRWVAKFGAYYAGEWRRRQARAGRTWHLDETAVRVGGQLQWLWRAVDEHGQTLDVLLQAHRDTAAAERFFRRLLTLTGDTAPAPITTGKLGSYAAVLARLPTLAGAEHLRVRSALRCNNRVDQAHQPTRVGERVMHRFTSAASAQQFLEAFSRVANLFRSRCQLLRAQRPQPLNVTIAPSGPPSGTSSMNRASVRPGQVQTEPYRGAAST